VFSFPIARLTSAIGDAVAGPPSAMKSMLSSLLNNVDAFPSSSFRPTPSFPCVRHRASDSVQLDTVLGTPFTSLSLVSTAPFVLRYATHRAIAPPTDHELAAMGKVVGQKGMSSLY
jgi:hypothetical protein